MTNRNRPAEPTPNVCDIDRLVGPSRRAALRAIGEVVYAVRLDDGCIKIGSTRDLYQRMSAIGVENKSKVELLAFSPGRLLEEMIIHDALGNSLARGREYYHPTGEVLEVVNEMRETLSLPPVAA